MEHQFWQLEHWGAHCALQDEYGQRVTYNELAQRADAFAQQLTPKTRTLVLILCHNCIDCVAAYLGCLRHGHVPLLLAGNLKAELQSAIINTYQPDSLYHSTTPESSAPQFTLTARANSPTVLHPDLALLLSTSVSTGSPKVVRLSASNLQSNATAIAHYLELN